MAAQFENATSNNFAAALTSVTVTLPSGIVAGNLLVVELCGGLSGAATRSGWANLTGNQDGMQVLIRVADGNEGASAAFTVTTTNAGVAVAARFSGNKATSNADAIDVSAWSGTTTAPSVTTTQDDCLILRVARRNSVTAPGDFSGHTTRWTLSGNNNHGKAADVVQATAGATGTVTSTSSTHTGTIAIAPGNTPVAAADTATVSIDDAVTAIDLTSEVTDTPTVGVTDAVTALAATSDVADAVTVSLTETAETVVVQELTASDTLTVGITDTATTPAITNNVTASDTLTVGTTDATPTILSTLAVSDPITVSVVDTSYRTMLLGPTGIAPTTQFGLPFRTGRSITTVGILSSRTDDSQPHRTYILGLSPRVYLPADEASGQLIDRSPNDLSFTGTGTIQYRRPAMSADVRDYAVGFPTSAVASVFTRNIAFPSGAPGLSFVIRWRRRGSPGGADYHTVVHRMTGGTSSVSGRVDVYDTTQTGRIRWMMADSAGSTREVSVLGTNVNNGSPHHISGTVDLTTRLMILYLDGKEIGRATVGGTGWQFGTGVTRIGNASSSTGMACGDVDEFAVFERVLTPAEVAESHRLTTMGTLGSPTANLNIKPVGTAPTTTMGTVRVQWNQLIYPPAFGGITFGSGTYVIRRVIAQPGERPVKHEYIVVVRNMQGVALAELPTKNLQYSYNLDGPGSINFVLPLKHPKCRYDILTPGQRELLIYRDNEKVWGGYLWTAAAGQQEGEAARFGGEGWLSRLRRMHISDTMVYEQHDQFDIAWELIQYAQQRYDMGITRGPEANSGVKRDRTYNGYEFKGIGEALEQLAAVINGFDFYIDPDKVAHFYYPMMGEDKGHVFQLGKNVANLYVTYDATQTASEMVAVGAGEGDDMLRATSTSTTAVEQYGLLQKTKSFKDISVINTLVEHAEEELALHDDMRVVPQIGAETDDPPFRSYGLGDIVTVRANQGYININQKFRIIALAIALSNAGGESIQVYMDNHTDTVEGVS